MNIHLPCTPYDYGEDLNNLARWSQNPLMKSSFVSLMELALSQKKVLHMKLSRVYRDRETTMTERTEICTLHYGSFGFAFDQINKTTGLPFSWNGARVIDDDCFFAGIVELESCYNYLLIHDISFEDQPKEVPFKRLQPTNTLGETFESWSTKKNTPFTYDEVITVEGEIYPTMCVDNTRYVCIRSWGESQQDYWCPLNNSFLSKISYQIEDKEMAQYWNTNSEDEIFHYMLQKKMPFPQIPNYTRNLSEEQLRLQLLDVMWYAECNNNFFPRYPKEQLKKFIHSLALDGRKWIFPDWMELPPMATSSLVFLYCEDGRYLIKIISAFPHQQPYQETKSEYNFDEPSVDDSMFQ